MNGACSLSWITGATAPSALETEEQESERYFFEEHSCPTNWLRDCVTVIEDGDPDPHGFMEFVRSVPIALDFDEDNDDAVRELFLKRSPTPNIISSNLPLTEFAVPLTNDDSSNWK